MARLLSFHLNILPPAFIMEAAKNEMNGKKIMENKHTKNGLPSGLQINLKGTRTESILTYKKNLYFNQNDNLIRN